MARMETERTEEMERTAMERTVMARMERTEETERTVMERMERTEEMERTARTETGVTGTATPAPDRR